MRFNSLHTTYSVKRPEQKKIQMEICQKQSFSHVRHKGLKPCLVPILFLINEKSNSQLGFIHVETSVVKSLHYTSSEAEFLHNQNAVYTLLKQLDTPFYFT